MKMRFAVLATLAALSLAGPALAQAPRGAAVTTLGTNKVTIDYGRPALKGRDLNVLMKDLPADRIWRAGENEVTTFTTEAPVSSRRQDGARGQVLPLRAGRREGRGP